MRINGYNTDYKTNCAERIQTEQDRVKESDDRSQKGFPDRKDEYIDSEKSGRNVKGLYHLGKDENGNPKVRYEEPEKKTGGKEIGQEKEAAKGVEECKGSTDKVDREIEKLKERKQQLTQQIKAAGEDEKKVRELERKLAQVEMELSRKDNDAYRKQNMTVS